MIKCKYALVIVGIIVLVMGILGLVVDSADFAEPEWHAVLKIIVGVAALIITSMEK